MNLKDPKTKFLLEVIQNGEYGEFTRRVAMKVVAARNAMTVEDVKDYIKFGSVQPHKTQNRVDLMDDYSASMSSRVARAVHSLDGIENRGKRQITGMMVIAFILMLIMFGIIFGMVIISDETAKPDKPAPITTPEKKDGYL